MRTSLFFGLALLAYVIYFSGKSVELQRKMIPALFNADSASVIYYNTPGNPQFFKASKVTDTASFHPIVENINGIIIDSIAGCSTDGKIDFYEGANAVHTVYFSRSESSLSFYFYAGAKKYFTRMTNETKQWLNKFQDRAIEPGASATN